MGSTISVVLLGVAVIASAAILARTYAQAIQPREDADGKPGKNAKRNKRRRENLKAKLHPDFASSEKQQQQQSVMERNQSTQSSAGPDPSQPVSVVGEDFQPLQQQSSRTSPSQPSSQRNNQRPLAERRAPRGRQGKVADMIDPEVDTRPTMARVVQINKDGRAVPQKEPQKQPASSTSSAAPTSALGESWVDVRAQESSANDASLSESEDLEEEEEEAWEQVPNKASGSKAKSLNIGSSYGSSNPTAQSDRVVPGLPSKKARQNAAKKAAAKSSKEAAEAERLASLQAHRSSRAADAAKQSQRARMAAGVKSVRPAPLPPTSTASNKNLSGGMRYGMSESGNLIWE